AQAVLVVPGGFLAAGLVSELDGEPGAQDSLGAQHVLELAEQDPGRIEILRIRPEAQGGADLFLRDAAHDFQRRLSIAVAELHAMDLAIAADADLDTGRKGIDHRYADAMQAAGKFVVPVRKLAARM